MHSVTKGLSSNKEDSKRPGLPVFEFERQSNKSPIYLHSQMRDLAEIPDEGTDRARERYSNVCVYLS